jgi:hypothetical protein
MDCNIIVAYEIDTRLRLIYHFSTQILLFKFMQNGLSWEVSSHLGGKKMLLFVTVFTKFRKYSRPHTSRFLTKRPFHSFGLTYIKM